MTSKTTNMKTLVTICNYCKFQDVPEEERPTERPADDQLTTSKRPANDQPNKNVRIKEYNNYSLTPRVCEETGLIDIEVAKKVLINEEYVMTVYRQYHEDVNSIKQGIVDYLGLNTFRTWESEADIRDHFLKWWRKDHPVPSAAPKISSKAQKEQQLRKAEEQERAERRAQEDADRAKTQAYNKELQKIMKEQGCDFATARKIYNERYGNITSEESQGGSHIQG